MFCEDKCGSLCIRATLIQGFYIVTVPMKVRSDHEPVYNSKIPFCLRQVIQLVH
jgi:hypothetical protein